MGSANFSCPLIVVSDGDVILASERNGEFTNISTNFNPTGMSGYQDNTAQKQLQEDPATGLTTSLAKDIEQLRYQIAAITGETYWYTAPSNDLTILDDAIVQENVDDVVLGDGTKTSTTPLLTLNADTGDAGIRLQVNDAAANAWDIFNDNSDSDTLKVQYNALDALSVSPTETTVVGSNTGTTGLTVNQKSTGDARLRLQVNDTSANAWDFVVDNSDSDKLQVEYGGTELISFRQGAGSTVLHLSPGNITAATAPSANTIYPRSIVKAWGTILGDGTTSPTIEDGFNVDTVSATNAADSTCTINFHTAMADTDYAVMLTGLGVSSIINNIGYTAHVVAKTTTSFTVNMFRILAASGVLDTNLVTHTGWKLNFTVIGRQ
jgi:hypothetical protein